MEDLVVVTGTIVVKLFDADGRLKHFEKLNNLITDAGDLYQASRIAAGVNSNGVVSPNPVTGMKLGTGTAAASKNGSGATLSSYLSGSNKTLDAGYPQVINLGSGQGVNVSYRCTWDAGVATSTIINEIVIVIDAAVNSNSSTGNTIARAVFGTTINKLSSEALEITWNHKQLGA